MEDFYLCTVNIVQVRRHFSVMVKEMKTKDPSIGSIFFAARSMITRIHFQFFLHSMSKKNEDLTDVLTGATVV